MGSRESNVDRLLENAEEYLIRAERKAKQAWESAKQNLEDWRRDMDKSDGYYRDIKKQQQEVSDE